MSEKVYVIYDERARFQDTDECAVLEACGSLREGLKPRLGIEMATNYVRSEELIRTPMDLPAPIAKLLQAAGVEHRAPEDVGGLLFGCLAHLSASVHQQFPEHWEMFRWSFIEATDELRDVLTSPDPSGTVAEIMAKQRQATRGESHD